MRMIMSFEPLSVREDNAPSAPYWECAAGPGAIEEDVGLTHDRVEELEAPAVLLLQRRDDEGSLQSPH